MAGCCCCLVAWFGNLGSVVPMLVQIVLRTVFIWRHAGDAGLFNHSSPECCACPSQPLTSEALSNWIRDKECVMTFFSKQRIVKLHVFLQTFMLVLGSAVISFTTQNITKWQQFCLLFRNRWVCNLFSWMNEI